MDTNLPEVPSLIEFARNRNISAVRFRSLLPLGRARTAWKGLRPDHGQALRVWKLIQDQAGKLHGEMELCADRFSINIQERADRINTHWHLLSS